MGRRPPKYKLSKITKFKPNTKRVPFPDSEDECHEDEYKLEKEWKGGFYDPINRTFEMVWRDMWEPIPPVYRFKTQRPVDVVLLRYTGSKHCWSWKSCCERVQELQKNSIDKDDIADIRWNFVVGGDGRIYEGTGWHRTTSKEEPFWAYEFRNLDIAYIGQSNSDVGYKMRWACRKLLEQAMLGEYLTEKHDMLGDLEAVRLLNT